MVARNTRWRRNVKILNRLYTVEEMRHRGKPIHEIAHELGVSLVTISQDIDRLEELWKERINKTQEEHRAQLAAELDDVRYRSLSTARYAEKPSAHFGVARQATVDKARLLGVMVDKQELTGANGQPLFPLEQMRELYLQSKERDNDE